MPQTGAISKLRNYWFTQVNNSPLIVFRILFGCIMFMEFAVALNSGWVTEVFVRAPFRFTFIGFEFLQALQGPGMYIYYVVACLVSAMVILGLFYRYSSVVLALMWTVIYFSQKGHYNNHYYLMVLICWLMVIVPAGRRASLDVMFGWVKGTNQCARWCLSIFIIQIAIVYTYASIAKWYPDWLHAMPMKIWFKKRASDPRLGFLFSSESFMYFIAYSGILFDLLIVPALLWKRTRVLAVIAMLIFHQFNKIVFGIGVFPYLAMSLNVFFFPGATFDNTVGIIKNSFSYPAFSLKKQTWITWGLCLFIAWQILTPLRHHLYKGDVVFTEEGHRMSWRMMLRSKRGSAIFMVRDKHSDSSWVIQPQDVVLKYQSRNVATRPDFIWQFAQYLEKEYANRGYDVTVKAKVLCSLNGRPQRLLVDSSVDLAAEPWLPFTHHKWILTDYK
ncbi:MAG: HTTM domain-containing protein [Chitinophagales bacterium]|nr:HTTM domain-containing protein [Chitinophagales bacterium]